ncbi:MAG: hypothetical protein FWG98_05755 [Candidatus Cloacimonetes bacterium]|nr:hypothetical protein [Candidatus Cloacimonadota bacterium]
MVLRFLAAFGMTVFAQCKINVSRIDLRPFTSFMVTGEDQETGVNIKLLTFLIKK